MKQHPVTIEGKPDPRYTVEREFCGHPEKRFVARFCGDWIGQSQFYTSAVMLAVGHNMIRKGAQPIVAVEPPLKCYRIIRFYRNGRKPRTIKNGLTEAQAQAHCSREDTRKEGVYFDGYDLMKGVSR